MNFHFELDSLRDSIDRLEVRVSKLESDLRDKDRELVQLRSDLIREVNSLKDEIWRTRT